MKITKAFCVEARKNFNIYEAKRYYFEQDEKNRNRLSFICTDEQCQDLDPPVKITGINYDKSFEEEDAFKAPHYKNNTKQESGHHPDCEWIKRELDEIAISIAVDSKNLSDDELPNRYRRIAHSKNTDIIDKFWLEDEEDQTSPLVIELPDDEIESNKLIIPQKNKRIINQGKRKIKIAPLISNALHELVTCYRDLSYDERQTLKLQLGLKSPSRTYNKCFCHIKNIEELSYLRNIVFYGGAYICSRNNKAYTIKFFDEIQIDSSDKAKKIELYITIEEIKKVPYWPHLLEILDTVFENKETHYLNCYLFLPEEPRYNVLSKHSLKVDIELPSIKHLELIAHKK